jgi:hypothetical protein
LRPAPAGIAGTRKKTADSPFRIEQVEKICQTETTNFYRYELVPRTEVLEQPQ